MNQEGLRTRKELILLWREGVKHPQGTFEWLKGSWFSGHYHVRAPDRMYRWPIKVNVIKPTTVQTSTRGLDGREGGH